MQITLKWENLNTLPTMTEVYRSASPIDANNLPPVLATVDAKVEQFVDDIPYGSTFYYRLRNVNAKGAGITGDIVVEGYPYTGPGPAKLIVGDFRRGYFGPVHPSNFLTSRQFFSYVAPWYITYANDDFCWHKFAIDGKVVYFPSNSISSATNAQTLYSHGLLGDSNEPGTFTYGYTGTPQGKTFVHRNNAYRVRLPRATSRPNGRYVEGDLKDSEAWAFTGRLLASYDPNNRVPSFANMKVVTQNDTMPYHMGNTNFFTSSRAGDTETGIHIAVSLSGDPVTVGLGATNRYRPVVELDIPSLV